MKTFSFKLVILAILVSSPFLSSAQRKLKSSDLINTTWKMKIDVSRALEEAEEEMEEEDNVLGKIIVRGVSGFVDGIIDNIDIYFEFLPNNRLKVMVEAFYDDDVDYTDWRVNSRGELVIGETEHFKSDDDSTWILDDGLLVNKETLDEKDANVFLVKID